MAKKKIPRSQIREAGNILKEIFQVELAAMADGMIAQIMARARRSTPSSRLAALKELSWPGELAYRQKVLTGLAAIAGAALKQARRELPKAKKIRLAGEDQKSIKLDASYDDTVLLEDLPSDLQDLIKKRASLLVGTQLQDVEKNISFQYVDSYDTTDDMGILEDDLNQAAMEYIDGQAISAGANLLAAKTVNDARSAFFFDSDVLEEVDAFIFTNGDPVTPICQDLAGTVFAKDDPEMFRYTPPLHWNCKSYIEPIPAGELGNREIEPLKPSTADLEDDIQFSEAYLTAKMHESCCSKK